MANTKQTRRALLAGVLGLVVCAAMLIGTTFAWFTDSVSSGKNQIVAGNLDVELEYATVENGAITGWTSVNGATDLFDDGLWEPGYAQVVYLRVQNLGSLALKYQLSMNILSEIAGVNMNGDTFNLSDYLQYGVVLDQRTPFETRTQAVAEAAANAAALREPYTGNETILASKDVQYLALVVYMPETFGNEANYRGTDVPAIELGLNLVAGQAAVESDSFNNQYDLNAKSPIADSSAAEDALRENGTENVVIATDMTVTAQTERLNISSDKNIDFSNSTFTRESGTGNGLIIGEQGYHPLPVTVTIDHANFVSEAVSATVRVESGSTVTFRNSTFTGREALQAYAQAGQKTTLLFENCTFDGEVSLDTASGDGREYDVTFRNCTFTGTFGNGGASVSTGAQAYGNITLENCQIDIEYTGNAVCGVNIGSYYGSNGNNPIVVTLRDTTIAVEKSASASGGIFGPTEGEPVRINSKDITTLNIEGTCTFTMNGVAKTFDTVTKEWN